IAAALRGAHVTAIDIDAEAVTTTADNAVRNGVTISVSATPLADVAGEFDVVVANMTIGSLGPLLPDIVRRVRPGGIVIVSGLLVDQWPSVQARLAGDVVAVRDVEDWVSAAVRC
ncbi:MAG: 50S ribosomal protein L11 methyltransferase, partial [Acidimicrobiales bacterium]|nr:50S ribosomal protein L11 methyltransferase [Acidimicrobiales bacterium]